jgi:hypothetical protein
MSEPAANPPPANGNRLQCNMAYASAFRACGANGFNAACGAAALAERAACIGGG